MKKWASSLNRIVTRASTWLTSDPRAMLAFCMKTTPTARQRDQEDDQTGGDVGLEVRAEVMAERRRARYCGRAGGHLSRRDGVVRAAPISVDVGRDGAWIDGVI
ncbi:hypothetical protein [Sorangium cellulosum]|uniref:hypothetical protein n=1 Tax=Sorangium cellulosum TaxID=56 RepID=UPI001331252F|nr:hypothetical protein [Sorangium cellulosum]